MVCIYIFSSERYELKKTQAEIVCYEKKKKKELADIQRRRKRTKEQNLKELEQEKQSIESELEHLSKLDKDTRRIRMM